MMIQLQSQYFTLEELMRSGSADRLHIDNALPPSLLPNLQRLCTELLDPLRDALGQPLYVSSGYRSPRLNRAIGGSPTSAHLQALAADLYLQPGCHADNARIATTCLALNLPFDQLIYERATSNSSAANRGAGGANGASRAASRAASGSSSRAACITACRWVHLALAPAGRPARQQTFRTDPLGRYR